MIHSNLDSTFRVRLLVMSRWWPLAMARELDDATLHLRTNETALGLWLLDTRGDARAVLAIDDLLRENQGHWFVREVLGMLRRPSARLDVSPRSLYALVTAESCFAGTLCELLLAADRVYMRDDSAEQAYGSLYGRLASLKRRYDPTNCFRGNRNIQPSA